MAPVSIPDLRSGLGRSATEGGGGVLSHLFKKAKQALREDLVHQAMNHGSYTIRRFLISQAVRQRQPGFVLVCRCACVCYRCLRMSERGASPHLSSVAHADESAHGLESTGSTGQEVGAVVGLQEANKVGALRLQNTETRTFVRASLQKYRERKGKKSYISYVR